LKKITFDNLFLRYTAIDCRKLTAVEVVVTNSPLYKLTFFPTDRQTNLPQRAITFTKACTWEFYCSVFASQQLIIQTQQMSLFN